MKVHEYQAKEVLARYGVAVPRSTVVTDAEQGRAAAKDLGGRVVVGCSGVGLDARIANMRNHVATEFGLLLPEIRLTDDPSLPPGTYVVRIQGVEQARDVLKPTRVLAILSGSEIDLPPGYVLEWEGEYKASREANEGLALSAPFGFTAMVLAVVVMFNALRQPLVIWLTAPLALVGVTIGLLLFKVPFEFMAILGFLSLIGMLVKNSIVLVDEADSEIRAGKQKLMAVTDAAVSRARPVFLGALTTILGVAPLLADPFFKSMAVTIMFGLAFATALTLVVVPLLYTALFRIPGDI